MAALKSTLFIRLLFCTSLPFVLSGCAEFRAIISVLFNGAQSLSISAFEFDEIKSGAHSTCAILGDKTTRCVGNAEFGNLGTYDAGPVEAVGEVKQVSAGKEFTCFVIGANSQAFCFGKNDHGQLGNPSFSNSVKPIPVLDSENSNKPLQDVKMITAGDFHACALIKSGRVVCWGDNSYGQTGIPGVKLTNPHSVLESERNEKALTGVHAVAAGGNSTCIIIRDDLSVVCFGERYGTESKVNWVPERIEIANGIGNLNGIKEVGVGERFACALGKNSQVYCWGQNDYNQLGALSNLPGSPKAVSVQVTYPEEMPLTHIETISVGENHACAINRDEKTVFCWGDNRFGQLGNTSVRGNPEQVALGSNNLTLKGVKTLAVGAMRTCITSETDELFCWGNGAHGLLGNEKTLSAYPSRVLDATGESLGNIAAISIGHDHTCLVDDTHKLYCFGLNTFGQLGFKGFSGSAIGENAKPLTKVSSLDSFGDKTCLVYGDSQGVGCFGGREIDNINKHVEHNSFITEDLKGGAQGFKNALGVSVGKNKVCVIESSQGVSCMSVVDISGSSGFSAVLDSSQRPLRDIWQLRSREDFNCGLTQENGGIWCWGDWKNDHWETAKLIPTQGKTSTEYLQFSMSNDQVCGVRGTERVVYCTKFGETVAEHLELQPVVGTDGLPIKGILMMAGGDHHFCAADEDGKLFCWGQNDVGQLGFKSSGGYQQATHIVFRSNALKKISRVSAGDRFTCVASSDVPSLFCFGESLLGSGNSIEPSEYPL